MVISNRDMKDVTGNYLIYVMEEMLDGGGTGIKAMLKNLADLDYDKERMLSFLEEADGVISVRVTVTAVKKNGQWRLHLSDSFINAFSVTSWQINFRRRWRRGWRNWKVSMRGK